MAGDCGDSARVCVGKMQWKRELSDNRLTKKDQRLKWGLLTWISHWTRSMVMNK